MLGESSDYDQMHDLLRPIRFADWRAARRCLLRIADASRAQPFLIEFLPHLLTALSTAANPDRVLVSLERFVRAAADDRLAMLHYLANNPRAVEILVTLFAGSQFLTEILLRNPEYLELLMVHKELALSKSVEQFCIEARACVADRGDESPPVDGRDGLVAQLDSLRRYQRWELLRIGACDLLGLFDLPAVTAQLSSLAESLIQACLELAAVQTNTALDGFAVVAMGKLGGNELNYSSDIDLLFLARSDANGYRRLGERLIDALASVTAEGFLYRVDMRLRPWGRVGPLVTSLDGYVTYLEKHARQWERQALLKARVVAGDGTLGGVLERRAEPLVFGVPGHLVRADVHTMKQRTEEHLSRNGREWGEVKLGKGSIRDVEFVAQYLQLVHGADQIAVRSRNTLDALVRLSMHRILTSDEYRVLTDGYVFLRTIEHHLQMMNYRQTYTLPTDKEALVHLAQRLGFRDEMADEQFITQYEQHQAAIRAVYLRHLGSGEMENSSSEQPLLPLSFDEIRDHLARMDPSYADAFSAQEIKQHTILAEQLNGECLVQVDAVPLPGEQWRVTIVGYDYPGELSLICGLLFVYGFSILDGHVFTYEPEPVRSAPGSRGHAVLKSARRKIVDVFTVSQVSDQQASGETWIHYADDLGQLLRMMDAGRRREARGELAKRVAAALPEISSVTPTLYPVDIEIDNEISEKYTVLHIGAPDTIGFLYEFSNALATNRIYIARVVAKSVGDRVHDALYVTDADGHKVIDPDKQRELRAATVLIKHFTHLLPHSPNPEAAMLHFRQFVDQLFRRPDWPSELASLGKPDVLGALARVLGVSDFLWNDFLRMQYANLFPVVRDVDALETSKSKDQLQSELEDALRLVHVGPQIPSEDAPWRATLNAFKDREMFRVDMRHILGHTAEFWDFSGELTDLAEIVVNSAYHLCHEDLRTLYGTPYLPDGRVSEMVVCALGKCGGRELGFASDIELMFVYSGNGKTGGPHVITTTEFYEKVVQIFAGAIQAKREGIFHVDLQLRPYGKAGSMAVSLEAFRRYFEPGGPAWAYERQALVKLRPIAGNVELGHEVVRLRDQFVYTGELFDTVAMRAMRERQIRHLVTGGTFNAKFSPGGLVDIEYLVQGLQITHGHRDPALRVTNIREAMAALHAAGIMTESDYEQLRRAHTFLRWLIDGLRMVRGNAQDLTVPAANSEAFSFLARRLRYGRDVAQLSDDLVYHTARVQELNALLLR